MKLLNKLSRSTAVLSRRGPHAPGLRPRLCAAGGPRRGSACRGGRGGGAPSARQNAPIDLTGYWVSVISEDWEFRMVTPDKGIFDTLTLNNEGRRVGQTMGSCQR